MNTPQIDFTWDKQLLITRCGEEKLKDIFSEILVETLDQFQISKPTIREIISKIERNNEDKKIIEKIKKHFSLASKFGDFELFVWMIYLVIFNYFEIDEISSEYNFKKKIKSLKKLYNKENLDIEIYLPQINPPISLQVSPQAENGRNPSKSPDNFSYNLTQESLSDENILSLLYEVILKYFRQNGLTPKILEEKFLQLESNNSSKEILQKITLELNLNQQELWNNNSKLIEHFLTLIYMICVEGYNNSLIPNKFLIRDKIFDIQSKILKGTLGNGKNYWKYGKGYKSPRKPGPKPKNSGTKKPRGPIKISDNYDKKLLAHLSNGILSKGLLLEIKIAQDLDISFIKLFALLKKNGLQLKQLGFLGRINIFPKENIIKLRDKIIELIISGNLGKHFDNKPKLGIGFNTLINELGIEIKSDYMARKYLKLIKALIEDISNNFTKYKKLIVLEQKIQDTKQTQNIERQDGELTKKTLIYSSETGLNYGVLNEIDISRKYKLLENEKDEETSQPEIVNPDEFFDFSAKDYENILRKNLLEQFNKDYEKYKQDNPTTKIEKIKQAQNIFELIAFLEQHQTIEITKKLSVESQGLKRSILEFLGGKSMNLSTVGAMIFMKVNELKELYIKELLNNYHIEKIDYEEIANKLIDTICPENKDQKQKTIKPKVTSSQFDQKGVSCFEQKFAELLGRKEYPANYEHNFRGWSKGCSSQLIQIYMDLHKTVNNPYFIGYYMFIIELIGKYNGNVEKIFDVYFKINKELLKKLTISVKEMDTKVAEKVILKLLVFSAMLINMSGGINSSAKPMFYINSAEKYGVNQEIIDTIREQMKAYNFDINLLNANLNSCFITTAIGKNSGLVKRTIKRIRQLVDEIEQIVSGLEKEFNVQGIVDNVKIIRRNMEKIESRNARII